jgi:reactive chlorine resistance protein C
MQKVSDLRPSGLANTAAALTKIGTGMARYGLVAILLLIGGLKFTHGEAMGIQPLVSHSPLMFWLYSVTSVDGTARIIGTIEIIAGLLIASRPFSASISAVGGVLAILIFLITLSFMLSTPGVWDPMFPALSFVGAFLVKDIALLACTVFITGEAFAVVAQKRSNDFRAASQPI